MNYTNILTILIIMFVLYFLYSRVFIVEKFSLSDFFGKNPLTGDAPKNPWDSLFSGKLGDLVREATLNPYIPGQQRNIVLQENPSVDNVGTKINMMCPNKTHISSIYGNDDFFINKIGIKCSDGTIIEPKGGPGGKPFEINNPSGFTKLNLKSNKWNVISAQFQDNGAKIGNDSASYPEKIDTNTSCDKYDKVVGLHGDYSDVYKRLGITCAYVY